MVGMIDSYSSPHLCRRQPCCYLGVLRPPIPCFLLKVVKSHGFFLPALKVATMCVCPWLSNAVTCAEAHIASGDHAALAAQVSDHKLVLVLGFCLRSPQ